MKKVLFAALLLTGCGVQHQSTVVTSNPGLNIQILGTTGDGCTIYRFIDERTIHFVRCRESTTTAELVQHGKTSTSYEVQVLDRERE